jgi:ABC-type phosphate/phosphonate transport system substrate-binding protein
MSVGRIAALPMYDFPALQDAHDRLWRRLRGHLAEFEVDDAPLHLTRGMPHEEVWAHPRLLLGQACEYPIAKFFADRVRVVATPRYTATGCVGATYRSAILVRANDPARSLEDLRGRRCVINEWTSNSGMNLLRSAIAAIAGGARFFESVVASGSHRDSVHAVASGQADVAAVDCVTLAHLRKFEAASVAALRVLGWTPATPSLPLVTSATNDDGIVRALRAALGALEAQSVMSELRETLYLDGFELQPAEGFKQVLELERAARDAGYPELR